MSPLWLLLPTLQAAELPLPAAAQEERFTLDGYLRSRHHLYYNLDLDHGPTPTTGETLFPVSPDDGETLTSSDLRLRLDGTLAVVPEVKVHLRIDGLDGVVYGSTPDGWGGGRWAASAYASQGQVAPDAGTNSFTDSLALKRAWGEAMTPLGALVIGRMGMPSWGAGIVADPGDALDADFDQDVDRVGFATSVFDHLVGFSYDWNATGPTSATAQGTLQGQAFDLYGGDDVHTFSLSVFRVLDEVSEARRKAAGRPAATYGAWLTWRDQAEDDTAYWTNGLGAQDGTLTADDLTARGLHLFGADLYARLEGPRYGLLGEVAWFSGSVDNFSLIEGITVDQVTMTQLGAALLAHVELLPEDRLRLAFEGDYASGDDAPGFGVAPTIASPVPGDLDGAQLAVPSDSTVDNFRFSPNHRVDLILWRQIIGTVTDAVVLRPSVLVRPHPRLDAEAAVVWSRALEATSTPGGTTDLGTELDLSATWRVWRGLEAHATWGLFAPGAAFRNTAHDLDPTLAQAGQLLVAFRY